MLVSEASLRTYTRSVLEAWGMGQADAELTARLLVETDLRAIDSHGVSMLGMYEGMVRKGTLNMRPRHRVERDTPVLALIDADAGLGHPIAAEAMRMACDKALVLGLGAVGVHNSHHFGAAGLYAEMAAERGLLGLVTSSARTVAVIPTHGAKPMLGTNPIAFAAPAGRNPDFLLDMATSTVALNKVKVHALNKLPVPPGWVVDGKGEQVLDAERAFSLCKGQVDGGLMPLGGGTETGGHKGYGLALLAQILGSTLVGGSFSPT
ncbi:MAG: Ldh family oxidoreductase, partial [Comamonadaceae bacterium]